jgi:hypothetical protein
VSHRKDWVSAKAQAAKANSGKDVWKDFRLKDLGLGPALDAFDAAAARFDTFDKKFNETNATRQQKDQWIKLVTARDQSARKAIEIIRNYDIDLDRLKSHRAINDQVYDALTNGLSHSKIHVAAKPADTEQLRKKIARLGK